MPPALFVHVPLTPAVHFGHFAEALPLHKGFCGRRKRRELASTRAVFILVHCRHSSPKGTGRSLRETINTALPVIRLPQASH
ncbi:hypothetical protein RB213_001994 [Colletotrichum asianum]